jgi:hypothetical protein
MFRKAFSIVAFVAALFVATPLHAQNHADIVREVAAEKAPDKTLQGALDFTLRVIRAINERFPNERVGLLEKTAGENIVPYTVAAVGDKPARETLVSAARIAYPDNHLFKVLTDVPSTNGPEWAEDGYANGIGYMVGYLAVSAPPAVVITVVDPPAPPPGLTQEQVATLLARIDALELAIRTRADENTERVLSGQRELRNEVLDGVRKYAPNFLSLFGIGRP